VSLALEVARTVDRDLCNGCGVCASLTSRIAMGLDAKGFARPIVSGGDTPRDALLAKSFREICPGIARSVPERDRRTFDPIFGPCVAAFVGHASDPEIRFVGSSGGVLTALAKWMLETGERKRIGCARASDELPTQTVPVVVSKPSEILATAGSRYAPVSVGALAGSLTADDVLISKPCETAGVEAFKRHARVDRPLLLSFFCAGTPSQHATERLVSTLGGASSSVTNLRYRGHGWPGDFAFTGGDGVVASASYSQAWGKTFSRDLQKVCATCPDGTGWLSDISVGDYWQVDKSGYPLFEEKDGRSVVIARTQVGLDLIRRAMASDVLVLETIDITAPTLRSCQPYQVARREMLLARVLGRRLMARSSTKTRGYRLVTPLVRHPLRAGRHLVGAARRSRRK
jgi:coenzyme F420 hydrogenase subunit beta